MKRSHETVVYTAGVFDLFHVGHLNLLQSARELGDRLIVAVSTDELVIDYKGRPPRVAFDERQAIVRALQCVDVCIPQHDRDKFAAWERLRFEILVVGDDWYGTEEGNEWVDRLEGVGVRTVFLPYTRGVSTSLRMRSVVDPAASWAESEALPDVRLASK